MTNELEQFEAGENVTEQFMKGKRPYGIVVSVRLAPAIADRLVQMAEDSDKTVSELARQAIAVFVTGRVGGTILSSEVTAISNGPLTLYTNPGTSTVGPRPQISEEWKATVSSL